jgi:serine/threonine protein kinase
VSPVYAVRNVGRRYDDDRRSRSNSLTARRKFGNNAKAPNAYIDKNWARPETANHGALICALVVMQEQLGKYTVIRRLGVGGMAEVFLCKLVGIGGFEKHVVLKKIRADIASDDEFITMFFDEARLAANLTHPNIIQVFEVDQLEDSPYLAMEYVRGATLAAVHKKLRAAESLMDFGYVAYVFAGVCAGLDHAHNARDAGGRVLSIVHRDISPQNIIVSLEGTPKIFDFGVAKARGSLSLTGADRVKGKFAYMAPEQLRALPVDAKADVYAVGVCMYEAVTGRRPFTGQTEAELYAARIAGKFRMPSELVPSIPVELEHLILSAMAPDPLDRPTAMELHEALAAFCAVGSRFPTNALAIATWLKDLLGEEVVEAAYEGYSTAAPSLTPLPRSANLPATTNAVEAHDRRPLGLNKAIALLASAAVVLAAVLVAILLRRNRSEPQVVAKATPPAPVVTPIAPPPPPAPSQDDVELRRQVERMRVELEEAKRAEAPAPAVAVVEPPAEPARAVERTPDRPRDRERTVERAKKPPVRIAAAARAPTPSNSGSAMLAGSGNGSAKGSAAPLVGSAGSGNAPSPAPTQHVAAQVPIAPPAPARPVATEPVKITAVPAPPAAPRIASPGTLDAMPSFSKLAVDGSLTATEVHSALTRTIETLRGCYRSAAKKANQTPEVSIRVSFEIDEGARASGVRISGDTFGLGACAKDAFSGVRTRVAPDVGTVSVSTVVRFKPTR